MSPKSLIAQEFGRRLQALADALGGQKVLAERLGWSKAQVSRYCAGDRAPGLDVLQKISQKTGCNPSFLMGECDSPFSAKGRDAVAIDTYVTGGGNHWVLSDQLEPYPTEIPQNLTAYEVRGDSMEPLARDGQIIIAMSGVKARDGDLALVEFHDGEHTFKRIYRQGEQVILAPVNPAHKPEVRKGRDMRYAWRVWGVKF